MKFGDFFKPKWKHSDPKIRYEAIRELEETYNSKDLVDVVLSDPSPENQRLALKKISQEEALSEIVEKLQEPTVREKVEQKLNELRVKSLLKEKAEDVALEKVSAITHKKSLEELAVQHSLLKVREYCVSKLEHPSSFYKVLLKEVEESLALSVLEKALGKIPQNQMESLEKKAKSKAVRIKVKELSKQTVGVMPSEEKVSQAKLQLLCKDLGSIAHLGEGSSLPSEDEWNKTYARYQDILEAWESESRSLEPSESLKQEFETYKKSFSTHYQQHQRSLEARQQELDERVHRLAKKEELCKELEIVISKPASEERDGSIRKLQSEWKALKGVSDPDDLEERLNLRYQHVADAYSKEKKEQFREKTHEEKVSYILESLKGMAHGNLDASSQEKLEEYKKDWSQLAVGEESSDDVEFKRLSELLVGKLEQFAETQKTREAEQLVKMEALLPELEEMLENSDLTKIEKPFKDLVRKWKSQDEFLYLEGERLEKHQALVQQFEVLQGRFREAQEWFHWSNLKKKQEIYDKLVALNEKATEEASESNHKILFEETRTLQKEWKKIGPVGWDSSRELWDKYRQVLDDIYEKCQDYFGELEEERQANLVLKEALCVQVEEQLEKENTKEVLDVIKEAQTKWKEIGPIPKDKSDEIWERFRTACDRFFEKRRTFYDQQEGEKDGNLEKKIALCEFVEKHKDSTKWKETAEVFKKAQEDWKSIGPVPKEKMDEIWERFRTACDYFFEAREAFFQELESHKEENYAKKVELCEKAESLDSIEDDTEKFNFIKQIQADWKAVGPVDKDKMEPLWERFRKPIDAFFETRKEKFAEEQQQREENLVKKEALCKQAEELMESTAWRETSEKLKQLQAEWKTVGVAPRDKDKAVWKRFLKACDGFFHRMKEHYKQQDEQRAQNLRSKEDLCTQAEDIAGFSLGEGESLEDFIKSQNWSEAVNTAKELQRRWKAIGPVPKSKSEALWGRFRLACDYVFDASHSSGDLDLEDNLRVKQEICEDAEVIAQQVFTDAQMQKVKDLQKEWREVGPVPVKEFKDLKNRFKKACELVFANDERLQT